MGGAATSCDDGNGCTSDWCDPGSGACKHGDACDDGNKCTTDYCVGWSTGYHCVHLSICNGGGGGG